MKISKLFTQNDFFHSVILLSTLLENKKRKSKGKRGIFSNSWALQAKLHFCWLTDRWYKLCVATKTFSITDDLSQKTSPFPLGRKITSNSREWHFLFYVCRTYCLDHHMMVTLTWLAENGQHVGGDSQPQSSTQIQSLSTPDIPRGVSLLVPWSASSLSPHSSLSSHPR